MFFEGLAYRTQPFKPAERKDVYEYLLLRKLQQVGEWIDMCLDMSKVGNEGLLQERGPAPHRVWCRPAMASTLDFHEREGLVQDARALRSWRWLQPNTWTRLRDTQVSQIYNEGF